MNNFTKLVLWQIVTIIVTVGTFYSLKNFDVGMFWPFGGALIAGAVMFSILHTDSIEKIDYGMCGIAAMSGVGFSCGVVQAHDFSGITMLTVVSIVIFVYLSLLMAGHAIDRDTKFVIMWLSFVIVQFSVFTAVGIGGTIGVCVMALCVVSLVVLAIFNKSRMPITTHSLPA